MDTMTPSPTGDWSPARWALLGTALLLIALIAVTLFAVPTKMDNTATLGVITGAAVVIERVIETVWIVVSFRLGSWWPLNGVTSTINSQIEALNENYLRAFVAQAQRTLEQASAAGTATAEDIAAATKALTDLTAALDSWGAAAPDNQKLRALVAVVSDRLEYLGDKLVGLSTAAGVAQQAVTSILNFVGSFRDNPAKRLVSIYLGALLGVAVCGLLGLDLFHAVLDTSSQVRGFGTMAFHPGVAVTGLVVGLGAGPTHEVIRLLTEIKKIRRAENERVSAPTP